MQNKQISGRAALKLLRQLSAGLDDPMTRSMGAGGFVHQSFSDSLRRKGLSLAAVEDAAYTYIETRNAKRHQHKDPARLQWKERCGYERMMRRGGF